MRLMCGCLGQGGVWRASEYKFWIYKDQTSPLLLPPVSCHQSNMLNIAKSTSPVTPAAIESKDWMKASTLELQSGSEDESDILDAKVKEHH